MPKSDKRPFKVKRRATTDVGKDTKAFPTPRDAANHLDVGHSGAVKRALASFARKVFASSAKMRPNPAEVARHR